MRSLSVGVHAEVREIVVNSLRHFRTAFVTGALLAGALVLSACGETTDSSTATDVERGAAAQEIPVPEVESGEVFEETFVSTTQGGSVVSGVHLCVVNESSTTPYVELFGTGTGSSDAGNIARGDRLCVRGEALIGRDAEGTISVGDASPAMHLKASRPALWLSWVELIQPNFGRCSYNSYFVNGGSSYEDGLLRYTIKRLKDTNSTEFVITLSDPKKRSTDGQPVKCK